MKGDEGLVASFVHALRHRGPDGWGAHTWPEAGLVHTRLKIVDLSPAGDQPFVDESGQVWAIANGEIFNHRILRAGLQQAGHVFHGRSDCEVVTHLYEEHGSDMFMKLRGMFAVAVYDRSRSTLVLARDCFGIKPLYFAETNTDAGSGVAFASEISALLRVPGVDLRPDTQAVHDFVALSYIPAPATFYRGIRAVEPGEIVRISLHPGSVEVSHRRYHRWEVAPDPGMSLELAGSRAEDLLVGAVGKQLESDVPLGALLSGGIDSSLVSWAAQRALPANLRTFNVKFADRDFDESWAAQAVAEHIGTSHATLTMAGGQGSWSAVTGLLAHCGQPFADTSLLAFDAVSALMRQSVTVALSGDGGDEGFGGYDAFRRLAPVIRAQHVPAALSRLGPFLAGGLAKTGLVSDRLPEHIRRLAVADDTAILEHLMSWVRPAEHQQLWAGGDALPVRRHFEPVWDLRLPARASRLESISARATEVRTRLQLPNDYLFKVDIASMRHGLEVRVPMLDQDLFAFGLTLPHHLKTRRREAKRVLRAVAHRRLPAAVADKTKWGFGVPVDTWVDREFKEQLRDRLMGHEPAVAEFFHPRAYRPMVAAFCDGRQVDGISRQGLYARVVMLLSVSLALAGEQAEVR